MGLRKNAAGEWTETDNLFTAGIAAALRGMRMKREMSVQSNGTEQSVDMEDSTAVYEKIQVYMEITRSRDMELMDVDGDTNMEEVETEEIVQSIEAKVEIKKEVKMEFERDEHDYQAVMAETGTRGQSLNTIEENVEPATEGENEQYTNGDPSVSSKDGIDQAFLASYHSMRSSAESADGSEDSMAEQQSATSTTLPGITLHEPEHSESTGIGPPGSRDTLLDTSPMSSSNSKFMSTQQPASTAR